jgi:sugar/nucleoside kinase (ribokinase family)
MGIKICGVGCSLLDLIYSDMDFRSRAFRRLSSQKPGDGGLIPGGLVFAEDLERFANTDLKTIVRAITGKSSPDSMNLGGPAIAALVNTSQLCVDREIEIRFFAIRGNDAIGRQIARFLAQTTVNIDHYLVSDGISPATIVLCDPTYDGGVGERSFINTIGVASNYGIEDLGDDFFDADLLFFGGTAVVPEIHTHLDTLLSRGKAGGGLNVVSTVYDFRSENRNPGTPWPLVGTDAAYAHIDLLIMNSLEACKISGETESANAVHYFANRGVGTILVTQGPDPVLVFSDGSLFAAMEPIYLPVSERLRRELLSGDSSKGDTTGCGDNFAGGVLADLTVQLQSKAVGHLDLYQTCAWGICSGGLAGIYAGGVYAESRAGEKYRWLQPYVDQYRQQINNFAFQ